MKKKNFKTIGQEIRKLRKQKGWSQVEMASQLRIGQSHLSDLERGYLRPSKSMLSLLENLFSVSIGDIISEKDIFYKKGREFLEE